MIITYKCIITGLGILAMIGLIRDFQKDAICLAILAVAVALIGIADTIKESKK